MGLGDTVVGFEDDGFSRDDVGAVEVEDTFGGEGRFLIAVMVGVNGVGGGDDAAVPIPISWSGASALKYSSARGLLATETGLEEGTGGPGSVLSISPETALFIPTATPLALIPTPSPSCPSTILSAILSNSSTFSLLGTPLSAEKLCFGLRMGRGEYRALEGMESESVCVRG